MSKKSKKQRTKERKAQVRYQSGVTMRAVTPPNTGGKVIELKRPAPAPAALEPAPKIPPAEEAPVPLERTAESGAAAKAEPESAPPAKVPEAPPAEPSREAVTFEAAPTEHRTSRRVSVAVDIHLASDSHFFSGLSGDISEGGLFLSTYRPLSVGTAVDVEFSLPGTERPVHARGEVRWIREHSAEQPRGVGIAFDELTDEDREEIHSFCSSRPPLYYEDLG